jgi:hypothetical protein
MIVWGGSGTPDNRAVRWDGQRWHPTHPHGDGGRYDPRTDSWRPISKVGAPSPRALPKVVWTGRELIFWGGIGASDKPLFDGARYDPLKDAWTPMTNARAPQVESPAAVWTGRELIVWGRCRDQWLGCLQGARYSPRDDTWRPMSTVGGPGLDGLPSGATWTGQEMVLWGAVREKRQAINAGWLYDPAGDRWRRMTSHGAPYTPAARPVVVWTGREVLAWGGIDADGGCILSPIEAGGLYDPVADRWRRSAQPSHFTGGGEPDSVWTGDQLLLRFDDEWVVFDPLPDVTSLPSAERAAGGHANQRDSPLERVR